MHYIRLDCSIASLPRVDDTIGQFEALVAALMVPILRSIGMTAFNGSAFFQDRDRVFDQLESALFRGPCDKSIVPFLSMPIGFKRAAIREAYAQLEVYGQCALQERAGIDVVQISLLPDIGVAEDVVQNEQPIKADFQVNLYCSVDRAWHWTPFRKGSKLGAMEFAVVQLMLASMGTALELRKSSELGYALANST
jgi:hypothetical protein